MAIVSNDGFNAITGHPVVVKVSDRPDLTETPYVVALSQNDPVAGASGVLLRGTGAPQQAVG